MNVLQLSTVAIGLIVASNAIFAQQIVQCRSGGTGTIPQCQARDAQAQKQAQAQQVVQCHSGGTGTIPECQARDAQAQKQSQAQQVVQCHSGGTGTIPECQARDAQAQKQAQAQQVVQCHSGGTGTIPECQRRDALAQTQSQTRPATPTVAQLPQSVQCKSGGTQPTSAACDKQDAARSASQLKVGPETKLGAPNACSTPQLAGQSATACEPPMTAQERQLYGGALAAVAAAPIALAAGEWIASEYATAQGLRVIVTTVGRHLQTGYKLSPRALSVEAHHPIPMFLGGSEAQALYDIPGSLHMAYHNQFLMRALQAMRLPAYRSSAEWAKFMDLNPNAVQTIRQAIQNSAAEFDSTYGTKLLDAVRRNL